MFSSLPRILFLDACVLYPAQTRDLFMYMALGGLVRLKWSQRVQEEWIDSYLKNRPGLSPEQEARVRRTPQAMEEVLGFQEPLVEGYEHLVDQVQGLPDPNDRHVVAAAHCGGAEAILTFNLRDFPEVALEPWDLLVLRPDDYLMDFANALICRTGHPQPLLALLKEQRSKLQNPPIGVTTSSVRWRIWA
jgi:hypothetical protein